jgi:diguanylate cyclase (GGDEF)-like protein/PAS domain S-box-containing protein
MKNSSQEPNSSTLLAEIERLNQRLNLLEQKQISLLYEINALREANETYRILLDESSDPIFAFHRDGTYRYVNRAFADGVQRRMGEIIGRKIWDVFSKEEADKRYAVVKWVFENGQVREIEVRVPRTDGDRYYLTTVKPINNELGEVVSVICISKEITERKRMEEELRRLSVSDMLTGLYNRYYFETEVERVQESRLFPVAILMADLDDLKLINDTRGHAAGDEIIRRAARLFKATFRAEDIIARFGGDEFVVLLTETDETAARDAVERLRQNAAGFAEGPVNLSIGWATGVKGESLDHVMRLADDRMYQDKVLRKQS